MSYLINKIIATKLRKAWGKNDSKRDQHYVIPEGVKVLTDISYGPYGKWNLLDVNLPEINTEKPLPVIVNFHGGGFFYGTKEVYKFYAAELASKGFAVVNFNYRLSPEYQFPCHLEDCNSAISWIYNNAEKYNFDLSKLFFVGDSAGGNLVYFYSTIATNKEYAKLYNFSVPPVKPAAIAMNCALYKIAEDKNDLVKKAYIGKNQKKFEKHLKIEDYVTKDFPPSFLMSAGNDFLLPQLEPAAKFFLEKGVKIVKKVYGSKLDKNAVHVFHINIGIDLAKQCNADEIEFFKSF